MNEQCDQRFHQARANGTTAGYQPAGTSQPTNPPPKHLGGIKAKPDAQGILNALNLVLEWDANYRLPTRVREMVQAEIKAYRETGK